MEHQLAMPGSARESPLPKRIPDPVELLLEFRDVAKKVDKGNEETDALIKALEEHKYEVAAADLVGEHVELIKGPLANFRQELETAEADGAPIDPVSKARLEALDALMAEAEHSRTVLHPQGETAMKKVQEEVEMLEQRRKTVRRECRRILRDIEKLLDLRLKLFDHKYIPEGNSFEARDLYAMHSLRLEEWWSVRKIFVSTFQEICETKVGQTNKKALDKIRLKQWQCEMETSQHRTAIQKWFESRTLVVQKDAHNRLKAEKDRKDQLDIQYDRQDEAAKQTQTQLEQLTSKKQGKQPQKQAEEQFSKKAGKQPQKQTKLPPPKQNPIQTMKQILATGKHPQVQPSMSPQEPSWLPQKLLASRVLVSEQVDRLIESADGRFESLLKAQRLAIEDLAETLECLLSRMQHLEVSDAA